MDLINSKHVKLEEFIILKNIEEYSSSKYCKLALLA